MNSLLIINMFYINLIFLGIIIVVCKDRVEPGSVSENVIGVWLRATVIITPVFLIYIAGLTGVCVQ